MRLNAALLRVIRMQIYSPQSVTEVTAEEGQGIDIFKKNENAEIFKKLILKADSLEIICFPYFNFLIPWFGKNLVS